MQYRKHVKKNRGEQGQPVPAESVQRLCIRCGNSVDTNSRYCIVCGNPLDTNPVTGIRPDRGDDSSEEGRELKRMAEAGEKEERVR